jgi:hypothetical protein
MKLSNKNVLLVLFVLFLLGNCNEARKLSKKLREKKSQLKQGLIIMDSFVRALSLKRSGRVFKKLYTGTCIRHVMTPKSINKVIKRIKRKSNKIKRSRRNRRNKRSKKYTRRNKRRNINKSRITQRKRKNIFSLIRKTEYSIKARKMIKKIHKLSVTTLINLLQKFLVKCFGKSVFLLSLRSINILRKIQSNKKVESKNSYSKGRVLLTAHWLNKLLRSLKTLKGKAKKKNLRKIGRLLGKFVLRSVHNH